MSNHLNVGIIGAGHSKHLLHFIPSGEGKVINEIQAHEDAVFLKGVDAFIEKAKLKSILDQSNQNNINMNFLRKKGKHKKKVNK